MYIVVNYDSGTCKRPSDIPTALPLAEMLQCGFYYPNNNPQASYDRQGKKYVTLADIDRAPNRKTANSFKQRHRPTYLSVD